MLKPIIRRGKFKAISKVECSSYINTKYNYTVPANSKIVYIPPDMSKISKHTWPDNYKQSIKDEICEYIDWKMIGPWHRMSKLDQKVAYFLAFGEYGPRQDKKILTPQEMLYKMIYTSILFGAFAVCIFNIKKDNDFNKKVDHLKTKLKPENN
ncbi:uncharacterized protein SCODWIG_01692 [Saccharomycodes ludwigii]|uniref:Uncharacterized protein n=1 Tax=Saccharomycodes ludwigii TaxID=36035 RepID=A0A376B5L4_9ASCO|nr:hypothetical protein SCDLUD_002291 [Saccharomycodes ludwigii]KAH3900837.1 hypothetical protein SCDLUD_002291 [Saccharomycodes ludwigii]SSD59931.1 uncharacterized protein SCODWIG_01692 [Saccharomycodes ludwigii]